MQLDACAFIDKVQRVDAERVQHKNLGEGFATLLGIDVCHVMYLNCIVNTMNITSRYQLYPD